MAGGPLIGLFVLSLAVRFATSLTIEHAGYFDAFYYFGAGDSLADGNGLTDSVIWNYLDNPVELPRPALQYWMPLPSLLAWFGIVVAEPALGNWHAAQLPFVVLSSLLPPLSAALAWSAWRRKGWAISAGLLTLAAPAYIVAWVNTDSVTPYAVSVALTLVALQQALATNSGRAWFVTGLGAGMSHLSRIDGAVLVPIIAGYAIVEHRRGPRPVWSVIRVGFVAGSGYLLLLIPWWVRNIVAVGSPVPGNGFKVVLFRAYDDLFSYSRDITFEHYLDWGVGSILWSKVISLIQTLGIAAAMTSFVFTPIVLLLPRVVKNTTTFRCFGTFFLVLLTFSPLVATFPAANGVTLHSAASLIPWLMACVPYGVDWVVTSFGAWRKLEKTATASSAFVAITTVSMLVFAPLFYFAEVLAHQPGTDQVGWNEAAQIYEEVGDFLDVAGTSSDRVLVVDPPAMFGLTGYQSLVVPTDGPTEAAKVANDFDVRWMLLDERTEYYFPNMYPSGTDEAGWRNTAQFVDSTGQVVILFAYEPG